MDPAVIAEIRRSIPYFAPELVLSVMNGFEREVRRRIVNTNYNIFVMSRAEFRDYAAIMDSLRRWPGVVAVSPFVQREAMLTSAATAGMAPRFHGCIVHGVDAAQESLATRVIQTTRPEFYGFGTDLFDVDGQHFQGIVLGVDLGRELGVSLGDVVTLAAQADAAGPPSASDPKIVQRRFRVVGFLNSGFYEFDAQLAYVDLREAQDLFGFAGRVYGLGVRIADIYQADRIGARLDEALGVRYYTNNWMYMFRNVFTWMETERKLMTLVFVVIISIAAITVVGMLTMIVMEKRKAIGILKSLGATRSGIMAIFMIQGTVIGLAGALFGSLLGYVACLCVDRIGIRLPGDVYIIDTLPVQIRRLGDLLVSHELPIPAALGAMPVDFVVVSIAAVVLCFLATLYPSWEAARLDPVEAIRYE